MFYRTSFFTRLSGYDPKYPVFADWAFDLRAFPKTRNRYVAATVAHCRIDGRSSRIVDPAFYFDRLDFIFFNTPALFHSDYKYNLRRLLRMWATFCRSYNVRQMLRVSTILLINAPARLLCIDKLRTSLRAIKACLSRRIHC